MLLGRFAQPVEHHPGLDAGKTALRIELEDPVQVLGEVDHDAVVDGLAREAGAAAAGKDRRLVLAADLDGGNHIVDCLREHDANWNLPVDRGVVGVQRPAGRREANLAVDSG